MIEAGGGEERALLLGSYAVGADAIGAFEGFDGEAHLLAQAAGDEAADAVSLPVGSGHGIDRQVHLRRRVGADTFLRDPPISPVVWSDIRIGGSEQKVR